MFKLRLSIDKVSLFAQRFRDKEPNSPPIAWDGEVLHIPDEFTASAKALFAKGFALTPDELKAHAAYLRGATEAAGIKVDGEEIETNSESIGRMAVFAALAADDASLKVNWKTKSGKFVAMDAAAMAKAVAKRVADCMNKEAEISAAIFSGTVTSKDQIDAAFKAIK
jgi:hypothetical protein